MDTLPLPRCDGAPGPATALARFRKGCAHGDRRLQVVLCPQTRFPLRPPSKKTRPGYIHFALAPAPTKHRSRPTRPRSPLRPLCGMPKETPTKCHQPGCQTALVPAQVQVSLLRVWKASNDGIVILPCPPKAPPSPAHWPSVRRRVPHACKSSAQIILCSQRPAICPRAPYPLPCPPWARRHWGSSSSVPPVLRRPQSTTSTGCRSRPT